MRVLFLIDSLGPGGAQRQLVTLVRALDGSAVIPEVAYYHPIHNFRPMLEELSVPLHDLGPGGGRDPRVTLRLARLMRQRRFDVVNSYLRTPGILARVASITTPGSSVVVSERSAELGSSAGRLALERILAKRADAMIVNSDAMGRELLRLVPAWEGRIHVVPNGIEWEPPRAEERKAGERFREEHAGDAELLLGALGRVEHEKGPDLLVEALELLPERVLSRTRVLWVGSPIDEELVKRIELKVSASSLRDRFRFLPPTGETRRFYMGMDALVLPSRREGMPNVVMEALAHGRPVVAADVGDTAKLIRPADSGWLVPPGDPASLAEALVLAFDKPSPEREAMGARGAEHVLATYSAERLAENTVGVYRKVLELPASR